jgi:hypothetical protein
MTVPSDFNAQEKFSPEAMSIAPDSPEIAVGVELDPDPDPFPNWPFASFPQHRPVPSVRTAHEKKFNPAETFSTPLDKPDTCTK